MQIIYRKKDYLVAQIWKVEIEWDIISSYIEAIYELEYKLSMAKAFPFNGMPQRKENIIRNLENEARKVGSVVQQRLVSVYENWLEEHAILSPATWARKATEATFDYSEETEENPWHNVLHAVAKWLSMTNKVNYRDINATTKYIEKYIWQNKEEFSPAFDAYRNELLDKFLVNELRDDLISQYDGDLEGFNTTFNENLEDEDLIAPTLENMDDDRIIEEFEPMNNLMNFGLDEFVEIYGANKELIKLIYEKIAFPAWYKYWSAQGIDETRERIENVYEQLKSASLDNLPMFLSTINIAINTSHQTGSMTDYMDGGDDEIKDILNDLTSGKHYLPEWNADLEEVGFQVPDSVKMSAA